MHGRLKVKSTAEQLEAKRKEREKKLKVYTAATSKIFEKKKNGELDDELLTLTGEILAVNPDFYTLWNCRKETFLCLADSKDEGELQKMYDAELLFLEGCLKYNPKSYGSWHHRCFVMNHSPKPNWERELGLCNQFLQYDERNFHCWDYRRFVVPRAKVSPKDEFEFSMNKISNNFSNYSSWHYRSKLLPVIYPDPSQPKGIAEDALLKEYELVQNGFFTDPDDQSNWFYHRWLLGRGEIKQGVGSMLVSRSEKRVIVGLKKHVRFGHGSRLVLEFNNDSVTDAKWQNEKDALSYSTTWFTGPVEVPEGVCKVKVTLYEGESVVCEASLSLKEGQDVQASIFSQFSRFSQELSSAKMDTLEQELESITQLLEIETDNKWALLSVVLLMKALDPIKHKQDIFSYLDSLENLDFKRRNYYKDLRSKFIVEDAIDAMVSKNETSSLTLTDQKLTKFYHQDLLPIVSSLDLSGNQLTEAHQFSHLQNLHDLRLDDNQLESCAGLQNLHCLTQLSLRNNCLSSVSNLEALQSCEQLKTLDLRGNPLCNDSTATDQIKELLPDVQIVLKESE